MAGPDIDPTKGKNRQRLLSSMRPFADRWSKKLVNMKEFGCRMDLLPDSRRLRQHPYRTGPYKCELERKGTIYTVQNDSIDPSQFELVAPIACTKKKDGNLRVCVYYRHLYSMIVPDSVSFSTRLETPLCSRFSSATEGFFKSY